jgi:hypothetical protein
MHLDVPGESLKLTTLHLPLVATSEPAVIDVVEAGSVVAVAAGP